MKKKSELDNHWMALALAQAKKGLYSAHPNPRVGCVFVRDDKLLAQGFHSFTGGPHAEVVAASNASSSLEGATCYVTLEPCSHYGLTPPCVDLLISNNIARCVIATLDSNPKVSGQGVAKLQQAGIDVEVGVLEEEAKALNKGFFQRMLTGRPRVLAKVASSLDGKTAMASGESQWITSLEARADVHLMRASCGAVLTTWKTVSQDNAKMTARSDQLNQLVNFKQPLRAVLDRQLQLSPTSLFFEEQGDIVLFVSEALSLKRQQHFLQQVPYPEQLTFVALPEKEGHLDLQAALQELGRLGVNDVLIESGPEFLGALMQERLVDDLVLYMAPKLLGANARGLFNFEIQMLNEHISLDIQQVEQIGPDLKITAQLKR